MEASARKQIRLILEHFADVSQRAFDQELKGIFSNHAAKGHLRSGLTIKVALRTMEEFAEKLISDSVDEVAAVSKEPEAFALISETLHNFLSFLDDKVEGVAVMAGGGLTPSGVDTSIFQGAQDRFSEVQRRLNRQLEIHRFTFTAPAPRAVASQVQLPKADRQQPPNLDGRPPAQFWDDVWADIAMMLYEGDLQPKSQTEIEGAMAQLISDAGHSAAPSTIRNRARKLWTRWNAALDD